MMQRSLVRAFKGLAVHCTRGREKRSGLPLPPLSLRAGGTHFRANKDFIVSAIEEADRLASLQLLEPDTDILDLGCGAGRLGIGIVAGAHPIRSYCGIDVNSAAISWCTRHLTRHAPSLQFISMQVYNERYNRSGSRISSNFHFPLSDDSFDTCYAYSLFSHLITHDAQAYLNEVSRLLRPGGAALLTAFIEQDVPDETVNPHEYGSISWRGPLHCVRYAKPFFDSLINNAGLAVSDFIHGAATDGQSVYILGRD